MVTLTPSTSTFASEFSLLEVWKRVWLMFWQWGLTLPPFPVQGVIPDFLAYYFSLLQIYPIPSNIDFWLGCPLASVSHPIEHDGGEAAAILQAILTEFLRGRSLSCFGKHLRPSLCISQSINSPYRGSLQLAALFEWFWAYCRGEPILPVFCILVVFF